MCLTCSDELIYVSKTIKKVSFLSTNHELASQNSSSSKCRRFDCWATVFFRADINAGTGKNREINSLQLAYQLHSRSEVLTESRQSLITENDINILLLRHQSPISFVAVAAES